MANWEPQNNGENGYKFIRHEVYPRKHHGENQELVQDKNNVLPLDELLAYRRNYGIEQAYEWVPQSSFC